MYLIFLQDYIVDGIVIYKKDETNFVKDEMLYRYLIRKRIAVEKRY